MMWRLYQNNKIGGHVDSTLEEVERLGEGKREREKENIDINIPRYIFSVPQECRN